MDPNLDKYIQQPQMQAAQPSQPLMQTEQVQPSGMPVQQPVQGPTQTFTVAQSSDHEHGGKTFLKVLLLLIIIIGATAGIVYAGYTFLGTNKPATDATKNANVFIQPTTIPPTPTPSVYQSNPNDTSDNALNQDSQVSNSDLQNLDTALTGVDQGVNDQQPNLQ